MKASKTVERLFHELYGLRTSDKQVLALLRAAVDLEPAAIPNAYMSPLAKARRVAKFRKAVAALVGGKG